jgi:hypothetical protein
MKYFFQKLKQIFGKQAAITDGFEPDIRRAFAQLDGLLSLLEITEARSRTIEFVTRSIKESAETLELLLNTVEERTRTLEYVSRQSTLTLNTIEERTKTLEYVLRQSAFAVQYQTDFLQKLYVDTVPRLLKIDDKSAFNASAVLELRTNHPVAMGSNDHINPDSTAEGVSRSTLFVQDCISVLGSKIKTLDLGTGAAGLVFEFAMSDIIAIGVDGSDFCRSNRIGYWPLLPKNLFTCDITKPFSFVSRDTKIVNKFQIITMWEVLEHIAEPDFEGLFDNITCHLDEQGYFIGSVSLVEYVDDTGRPYHVTLKPREWWKSKFQENGLEMLEAHPFNEKFFCRGNGPRFQDFHNYAVNPNEGFWVVAKKLAAN